MHAELVDDCWMVLLLEVDGKSMGMREGEPEEAITKDSAIDGDREPDPGFQGGLGRLFLERDALGGPYLSVSSSSSLDDGDFIPRSSTRNLSNALRILIVAISSSAPVI